MIAVTLKVVANSSSAKPAIDKLEGLGSLVTKDEVSAYLGVTRRTLDTMMLKGRIRYLKIGHSVRFRVSDLKKALDSFTIEGGKK